MLNESTQEPTKLLHKNKHGAVSRMARRNIVPFYGIPVSIQTDRKWTLNLSYNEHGTKAFCHVTGESRVVIGVEGCIEWLSYPVRLVVIVDQLTDVMRL